MQTRATGNIRCRQIGAADLEAIAALLSRGFPGRSRHYWMRGLERQGRRNVPAGCPHYGYLLENEGEPVGCILLLFTALEGSPEPVIRCNLSSWYVEPAFRSHASLLISLALKHKHVTYTNISPAPHTWPTVEAQGFQPYCTGQYFALPALSRRPAGLSLQVIDSSTPEAEYAGLPEADLIAAHAHYGCTTLVCRAPDGDRPFIFQPFRIRRGRIPLPCMQLIYCRDIAEFIRFAGMLGRHLLVRHRMPFVLLDSNGPIAGLLGFYRGARGRKYYKGPKAPRLGDLAYTELVLFGP